MSQSTRWDSVNTNDFCFYGRLFYILCNLFICQCVAQFIEYEDYDNTTNYYPVNEYEEYDEEYDERYGPAERERDYLLNTQVVLKALLF